MERFWVPDGTFDLAVKYVVEEDDCPQAFDIGIYRCFDPDKPDYNPGELTPDLLLTTYRTSAERGELTQDTHTIYIPAQFEDAPLDYYLMAKLDIGRDDVNGEIEETEEENNSILFEGGVFLGADSTTNVVDRHVFYNHSAFDGNDPEANEADDNAIATDKFALLPGQQSTFRNITSYDKGINGIMVDIWNLGVTELYSNDFTFEKRNDLDTEWIAAPNPASITCRELEDGVTRVTLTWGGNAVTNNWLKVTVLNNWETGLAHDDVFYFGNIIADVDGTAKGEELPYELEVEGSVGESDYEAVAAQQGPEQQGVDSPYDIDRDGYVGSSDLALVSNNDTHVLELKEAEPPENYPWPLDIVHVHGFDEQDPELNPEDEGQHKDSVSLSPACARVFYDSSAFDGGQAGPNHVPGGNSDDNAIATDKEALMRDQAVTFVNVTSYEKGLNGIMVDLWDATAPENIDADDFTFKKMDKGSEWGGRTSRSCLPWMSGHWRVIPASLA